MEYMWLKLSVTQLSVDIFVDDGGSYLTQILMTDLG